LNPETLIKWEAVLLVRVIFENENSALLEDDSHWIKDAELIVPLN
jgi:hypothetical protein